MLGERPLSVEIRPWLLSDHALLERLMGDPAMMEHLGGPESPEKIRLRNERYVRSNDPTQGRMFAIVAGPERVGVGSIGYWVKDWHGQHVWETGWSVLPEVQGQGIAYRATLAVLERARADRTHRFIHAFPAVENGPSNAICRKAGFTLLSVEDFEYPPGNWLRCNNWCLDLFASDAVE